MRAHSLSLTIALLILPAAQTAFADDAGTYRWDRPAGTAAASLRMNGPTGIVQFDFAANQTIAVDASALPTGTYEWELVASPTVPSALRAQVTSSRAEGVNDLPSGWPAQMPTRSGLLMVRNGLFVSPVFEPDPEPARSTAKAAPITGDQTIYNSLCVGFSCLAAESFGTDTIRMNEDNTRIHFLDSSNIAGFPTNDWRIIANDNSSGGSNYLAIEDSDNGTQAFRVDAGAGANALRVNASGDVGIGTASPVVELHAVDGNTPALRLEQNGSNGFTAYTFDVAANETNFFVRDVNTSRLPFRIRPGAPTSAIDIDGSGNVGLGVASASAALHIRRNIADSYILVERTAGERRLELDNSGNLYVGGTITQLSSRHSKENLAAVAGSVLLAKLRNLDLWTWNYRSATDDDRHIGPVAEDFYASFGLGTDDRSLAPADVAGVALAASQALSVQIEQRDEKIATLEERIARLEAALEKISSAQR